MHSSKILQRILIYTLLALGSLVMLAPLAWMILTSLKSFNEVVAEPPQWLPAALQWRNYVEAFTTYDFTQYLGNSVFVTVMIIIGTIISSCLAAYGFACLEFRGKNILFGALLSTLMLPGQVTIIPLFQWFSAMGWIDTYWPLIIPAWLGTNVFAIFLLRQFFLTIPKDYVEAARIDGASELRILWNIFLPLSKPALLTVVVFTFIAAWNDLWGPLIYLQKEELYTMPIGLLNFIGLTGRAEGAQWQLVMAVSAVMMVPVIIIFFLAQKRFIEGIATTGIKG